MNWREWPGIRVVRRGAHRVRRFFDRPAAERGADFARRADSIATSIQELRAEGRVAHEAELDLNAYLLRELSELRQRVEALEEDAPEQSPVEDATSRTRRTAIVSPLKKR
jgi:hypothetical protein